MKPRGCAARAAACRLGRASARGRSCAVGDDARYARQCSGCSASLVAGARRARGDVRAPGGPPDRSDADVRRRPTARSRSRMDDTGTLRSTRPAAARRRPARPPATLTNPHRSTSSAAPRPTRSCSTSRPACSYAPATTSLDGSRRGARRRQRRCCDIRLPDEDNVVSGGTLGADLDGDGTPDVTWAATERLAMTGLTGDDDLEFGGDGDDLGGRAQPPDRPQRRRRRRHAARRRGGRHVRGRRGRGRRDLRRPHRARECQPQRPRRRRRGRRGRPHRHGRRGSDRWFGRTTR